MPDPVFSAAINYEYHKDKANLEVALKKLCLEDSSLNYEENFETG